MRKRGRSTILKTLRRFLEMGNDAFNCDGVQGERVVETSFYALEKEVNRLRLLGDERGEDGRELVLTRQAVRDAADRLWAVAYDLKTRSTLPSEYVREKTRNWRASWVLPLLAELERKEIKKS